MTTRDANTRLPELANVLTRAFAAILFLLALGLLMPARVIGASDSWNVDLAAQTWITAGDWLGGNVPGLSGGNNSTDIATFSYPLTLAGKTVTVDANRNVGGITFGNISGFGYTLATGPLWMSSGSVIQTVPGLGAHTETISAPIVVKGASGGSLTFTAGALTGQGRLRPAAITGEATAGNTSTIFVDGVNENTASTDENSRVLGSADIRR